MARGGHGGVEVAQRPCGGVAGIFQGLRGRPVVGVEGGDGHVALAVYLHAPLEGDGERHGADGQHLRQNLFADDAVAARGCAHQLPVFVGQVDGQPIELVFDDVFHRLRGQLVRARRPFAQRRFALRLVQTPQPRQMRVLLEVRQRLRAHAAGRRVRQALARFLLHAAQFVVLFVPLGVGNGRLAQRVILVGRLVEVVHQRAHIHKRPLRGFIICPL